MKNIQQTVAVPTIHMKPADTHITGPLFTTHPTKEYEVDTSPVHTTSTDFHNLVEPETFSTVTPQYFSEEKIEYIEYEYGPDLEVKMPYLTAVAAEIEELLDQGYVMEDKLDVYISDLIESSVLADLRDLLVVLTERKVEEILTKKVTERIAVSKLLHIYYFFEKNMLDFQTNIRSSQDQLTYNTLMHYLDKYNNSNGREIRELLSYTETPLSKKQLRVRHPLLLATAILTGGLLVSCLSNPEEIVFNSCPVIVNPEDDQLGIPPLATPTYNLFYENGRPVTVSAIELNTDYSIFKYEGVWHRLETATQDMFPPITRSMDISSMRWENHESETPSATVRYCLSGNYIVEFPPDMTWNHGDLIVFEAIVSETVVAVPIGWVEMKTDGGSSNFILHVFEQEQVQPQQGIVKISDL